MNALQYHILFTSLFATGLILTIWSWLKAMNSLGDFKSLNKPFSFFGTFKTTVALMVLTVVFGYASISALLVYFFGK